MRSLLDASPGCLGRREPRILARPPWVGTSGPDACDLLAAAGQAPDPWQADAVGVILAEGADGRWAARRTGMIAARQNGKGGVIEPLELFGMFVLNETILHSAHLFDTAREAFNRLRDLIEGSPDLLRRVRKISEAHGKEGILLASRSDGPGGSIHFHARTRGGGRGKSPHRIVLDEAYAVTAEHMAALLPAVSARQNPQVNLFSTPPPVGESAPILTAMRRSALAALKEGRQPEAAWIEWGAPRGADVTDPATWAMANPALGIRISPATIRDELDALGEAEFAVERCGIWPADGDAQWVWIPQAAWLSALDPQSQREGPVAFAIEVSPDRAWTSIGVAGVRADGLRHGELAAHMPGTGGVVEWVLERDERLAPCTWVVDPSRAAGSLVPQLEAAGVTVVRMSAGDAAAACGQFQDGIWGPDPSKRDIRVRDEALLTQCAAGAQARHLGGGGRWAFDSRTDLPLVSPLIAVCNALWAHVQHPPTDSVAGPWAVYA